MERLELMVVNGPLAGKRFAVGEGGVRLGRSSSNDIHIPDEELSRNHCLFEPTGESGVQVTDLASANGTYVNDEMIGCDPVVLRAGDVVKVGSTEISVGGERNLFGGNSVDLGLEGGEEPAAVRKRSPLANILWIVTALVLATAVGLVLMAPREEPVAEVKEVVEVKPTVCEMSYEKVDATLEGIYRYEVTVSRDGQIRVVLDDTKENRHLSVRPKKLDARAKAALDEILPLEIWQDLEKEYSGPDPEPQALTLRTLKVVYSTAVQGTRVVNTQEPESFRALRERLEAFVNNELGIHAIRYSREKLVQLAEEQIEIGKVKWEDREVQHGNVFAALAAYREALFYLETLNPKPECIQEARRGFEETKKELDRRTADQRFAVDRAVNIGDWESARSALSVLLEMIPDRNDDRNREATAKLVDVEKRLKGGK